MKIIASKLICIYVFAFLFILTFSPAGTIRAQTLRERHDRIRASVEKDDANAAVSELDSLRAAAPQVFALNNYDYLLARLSERRGNQAVAAAAYHTVTTRDSQLWAYSIRHLARLARATGNLTLEREYLRQLLTLSPTGILRDAARARLAASFFESEDYVSVIRTLRSQNSMAANDAHARESLALIGQAYYRSNQTQAAREVFNKLVTRLPDASRPDDFALAGVRGLNALNSNSADQRTPDAAPLLPESEHLRRANIYTFNRDFAGARRHYIAVIEHYETSANVAEALYQVGRGYYQERRFDEAIQWFERVLAKYPSGDAARDALAFKAAALARQKHTDQAITAYRSFIERFPDAPNPERPYLNIIDALRDAGRDDEALAWVAKTRERFNGRDAATQALFAKARIHQAQNAWTAALADFDALLASGNAAGKSARTGGDNTQTEIALMRAYTLEQLRRFDEAVEIYQTLPDGRNQYYGGLATLRLRALAHDGRTREQIARRVEALRSEARQALANGQLEQARRAAQSTLRFAFDDESVKESLEIARRAYAALPAYSVFPALRFTTPGREILTAKDSTQTKAQATHKALADELLFLGLYDEGVPEFALAENAPDDSTFAASDTTQAGFSLAVLFLRGDMANQAIRFAEQLWRNVPPDYLLELAPPEALELLYPAPYKTALLESAGARGVDPRFVLAIMRQESRFYPAAKSVAAARGLLQFIPSTADDIAASLGVRNFRQDELYDPQTTLLFGTEYMRKLFAQFPGMPEAVAASYNGGEDNVARWVARARSNDPERYVAEIGFSQSKDYVYKVLPNFRAYQQLYTEQLQRK
ncbi:MAG: transglycosylase SLT domain-containing protein [Pyrinomonadaceae bacterium]